MKNLLFVSLILLSGCATKVPVTMKFPEIPNIMLERCPDLKKLNEDAKLSDVAKTVTVNYSTYYECAVKHDSLVEWYQIQKKISESVK